MVSLSEEHDGRSTAGASRSVAADVDDSSLTFRLGPGRLALSPRPFAHSRLAGARGVGVKTFSPAMRGRSEATRLGADEHAPIIEGALANGPRWDDGGSAARCMTFFAGPKPGRLGSRRWSARGRCRPSSRTGFHVGGSEGHRPKSQ